MQRLHGYKTNVILIYRHDMSTIIKYIMNIKLNAKNNQNLQDKENTKKTKEEVEKPKN